jgi:DNA excision repair protein ERCC-4
MSILPLLPSYLASAFGDLYGQDGLLVMGKGLGWLTLLASLVRFYADVEEGHASVLEEEHGKRLERPPLVLVLNLSDAEHTSLLELLQSWGTPHEMMPTIITNESGQADYRKSLYSRGGVFCVTSRILIVDLLTNTLSSKDVDGILLGHAHQVTADSTEAFILRIYVTQQKKGFIKAITESPETLLQGFARIEKTLKALHVNKLYLYPRFHQDVQQELSEHPPQVTEFHQPISAKMKEMQLAIVTAVKHCMRELQEKTPTMEWNSEQFSLKNCVTSAFDRAVSRHLEHEWHKLQPSTKQLVQDLRVLRTLLDGLLQYDCVTFYKLLQSIKTMSATSRYPAMWLTTPAADLLYRKAKERMYILQRGKPTAAVPNPMSRLKPVLEENPKWRLLKQVLHEIRQEEAKQQSALQSTILVLVREERSAHAIRQYLVEGRDTTMALKWLRYLEGYNDRGHSVQGASNLSEESRLLLEEEGRVRRILFGDKQSVGNKKRKRSDQSDLEKKHRKRMAMDKSNPKIDVKRTEDQERQAVLEQAVENAVGESQELVSTTANNNNDYDTDDEIFETMFQPTLSSGNNSNLNGPKIIIASLSSMESTSVVNLLLQDNDPDHIVLYDLDIHIVRSIEIHSAMRHNQDTETDHDNTLKVYFLQYEASSEQKAFYQSLEKEKSAFERLVHYKQRMPSTIVQHSTGRVTQEMQQAVSMGGSYQNGALPLSVDTRSGGRGSKSVKRDIAVDVREFRSALPSILHQGGMRLAPVTLLVGDFVLSNVHCVERKSISDLFGSFASGRLFTQAEQMSKYYACPCLLIEFDPSKSFCLQNANELGVDIKLDSICSKLTLLVLHFPKLRLLWSKSPHETLKLFHELKQNHEEVDVYKAMEVGRAESVEYLLETGEPLKDGVNENDLADDDDINEAGRDMLLSLPGVTISIARNIMKECDSLSDLIGMSRNDLRRLAGPVTGQKLFTFFHQNMGSL